MTALSLLFLLAHGLSAQEPSTASVAATPASRVRVAKAARDWRPVSVKAVAGAGGKTFFERKIRRVQGAYRGESSSVEAEARLYVFKGQHWLFICLWPESLRLSRTHLEARFLIEGGLLKTAKVAAVTRLAGPPGGREDSVSLRRKGIAFEEVFPGSAEARIVQLDDRPGAKTSNIGSVRLAAFGDRKLGFSSFGWSLSGLKDLR